MGMVGNQLGYPVDLGIFQYDKKCKYMYLPGPLEPFHILKSNCCKVNTRGVCLVLTLTLK